jgi:hypothetical protein
MMHSIHHSICLMEDLARNGGSGSGTLIIRLPFCACLLTEGGGRAPPASRCSAERGSPIPR